MKKMKKLALIVAVLVAGLSACSKTESPPSKAVVAPENVQLDLATPDKALKSYWAVRDFVRAKQTELVERAKGDFRSAEKQMGEVADGALAKAFSADSLPPETFARDLIDVKVESESRAVIIAVIKNSTPVPTGGEMSKYDEERRRDGERYRYVLEKSQTGWRVSEIWQWSTYEPKNEWKKFQPGDGKPNVPSLTYHGI
jgi:hypothetical protein